jgi:peptidoglycan hydrolase-like protein with peptidoglycan-binding domain
MQCSPISLCSPRAVLDLQTTAGNRATTSVIQRQATGGPPTGPLHADRFKGNVRLQHAAKNAPPLRFSENDEAVGLMQDALLELRRTMPTIPDIPGARAGSRGHYGSRTKSAVRAFQVADNVPLPSGGEAGLRTLTHLDAHFTSGPRPSTPTPPTLADVRRRGAGSFQPFVDDNILDPDAGAILNFLLQGDALNWMTDSANLVHNDLRSGALAGMVKVGGLPALKKRVPSGEGGSLAVSDAGGNASYHALENKNVKGFIVLGEEFSQPGDIEFRLLVLVHELNHHRNRDQARALRDNASSDLANPKEYVDTKLAQSFGDPVKTTREHFVDEIAARHGAWRVKQQYDSDVRGQKAAFNPPPGALFAAAHAFAKGAPTHFQDNGYMVEVAKLGDNTLGEQVVMWMRNCVGMEYHGIAVASDVVSAFIGRECDRAAAGGFLPKAAPDGMA